MCIKIHIKAIYFVNFQETTVFSFLYVEINPMWAVPWVCDSTAAQPRSRHWVQDQGGRGGVAHCTLDATMNATTGNHSYYCYMCCCC